MSEWGYALRVPPFSPVHSMLSDEGEGAAWEGVGLTDIQTAASASAAWPATQRAIYLPIAIYAPFVVTQILVRNGTAVSGNVDAGIYTRDGTKLVSIGATTQAGTSALQALDITDTLLMPGLYYKALTINNTTGTTIRWAIFGATLGPPLLRAIGVRQEALGQDALKATATFAAPATDYVPMFALSGRSLV